MSGGTNIGHACTRQQCDDGRADKLAMRWVPATGASRDYTFSDLETESNRVANALVGLGLRPGDPVFVFLPRLPEYYVAVLGALKARLLAGPLFSNFGGDALVDRLGNASARAVITKRSLLKKLLGVRSQLPTLRNLLVIDSDEDDPPAGILGYRGLLASASADFDCAPTSADTPSLLHYTSGSTGKPKGVVHVHGSLLDQRDTARSILGLGDSDRFWCTADPGWVTGTSYGIIGPWSNGVTQVQYGGNYDPTAWFRLLEHEAITVWYTAPTALRMLLREDPGLFAGLDLSRLRHISSVGEPLNPEIVTWATRVLGKTVHDTWFQTETGAIRIANRPGLKVKPGSMGQPAPGVGACILDDAWNEVPDGTSGNLCLCAGWASMFVEYLGNPAAYSERFAHGYYRTGDLAHRDPDGYFWFTSRADDVINTAGHLVSPFEVESALLEVAEVAEAAVVGAPDPILYEKVVAFVRLRDGQAWNEALALTLRLHVTHRVSSIATPQDLIPVDVIPKNKSGKTLRRVLRATYLGESPGDTSTLEEM